MSFPLRGLDSLGFMTLFLITAITANPRTSTIGREHLNV
uniref:Uncharacterized protein n=1 Tax=Amphimedon queenslandica TaxID=400682 RepID=A0A1X7VQT3_AMPQE